MQKSSSKSQASASGPSFGVDDVLFVLFKHKWKIVFFSLLGFGVAAVMHVKQEPIYKSTSKLLVRYVMAKGTVDPFESVKSPGNAPRGKGDPVMNTEVEILYSVDLWQTVAEAMGVEKLAPGLKGDAALNAAVSSLRPGLVVEPGYSSSVLYVNYNHKNPKLSKEVLTHLLERYFQKHLDIHRSAAEFDMVAKQAADAKQRLLEKEIALDMLRKESGIMSLTDATAALIAQRSKTEEELLEARAELASKKAVVGELKPNSGSATAGTNGTSASTAGRSLEPPPRAITEYRSVMEILAFLQKRDMELRIKFKPGNRLIELNRQQINSSDARRRALEAEYPGLVAKVESSTKPGAQSPQAKWIMEKASLAAVEAKIEVLSAHLMEIRKQFSDEYTVGAKVEELQRERDMLDAEYRTLETKLKDARVNRTLDPSRMPNITVFQHPTEPVKTYDETMQKIIYGIAGSGVGLGLGLAFLIELLFNRKISRPIEIQTRLQLPLLLSIPYLGGKNRGRFMLPGAADLPLLGAGEDMELGTLSRDIGKASLGPRSEHFILPYSETLRDRIIFNFEINNVVHKPKFVAVTGLSEGAGASTIAAGLAKSFSEIKGAKVLLVDLSSLHPEQNPIYGEVPLHSLSGALELTDKTTFRENPENLYYASALARRDETGLSTFTPIHLYELMPHLQASAYDYIIFDMPVIDETSRTLAMAGLMDKVLLVLDAENTSRDALKWGYSELVKGKADVSCIFNKTRSVAPSWLVGEN